MRFKTLIAACLLVCTELQAAEMDEEVMRMKAQSIYEQSMKLMESTHQQAMPAINPHMGVYDSKLASMNRDADQKIMAYLQGKGETSTTSINNDGSKLFVLASFSMPDALLKQYIIEANRYGGSVVIIGLIDNDFMQTQLKIKELLGETQKGSVLIDPNLFQMYKVKTVPAIVLTTDEYPCQSSVCISDKFDIMYGAVHVKYALESFKSSGDFRGGASKRLAGKS